MHWIQTIREHLELSKEELAEYLGLSVHTIKSIEHDRRQLPMDSLRTAIALFNAVKDWRTQAPENESLTIADRQRYPIVRLHHQHCRRLEQCSHKLKRMQKAYAGARRRLGAYQLLAQALPTSQDRDDLIRLQWVKQKVKEAQQLAEDNNLITQHLLIAEIAGLKSMVAALEDRSSD